MFSSLTTKLALRKVGLSTKDFSFPSEPTGKAGKQDPDNASPFPNPFATIALPKSLLSWQTPPPPPVELGAPPVWGTRAPTSSKLRLPGQDGRPTVVVFMRNTGCPFAEKTFIEMRRLANKYPDLSFLAVSHASKAATDRWVSSIGGAWAVQIIVDEEREVYAQWGLGISNTWYVLSPWTQWTQYKLGKEEGVWGREVDPSGNHWQIGGSWACDVMGTVRWGAASKSADEIPDLIAACKSLGK
ncbi:hypothetical protein BP6252_11574 [Coleophoma cylindrospora]|uniref:Uncharacterized protein n=1 Tax=Coleophoma cylindrospora TaxID=1849047 RepID=A0A3D8QK97_9HELO|nr:hypothetical protein BP6252_11574 [Coleophoma cylindrospora]